MKLIKLLSWSVWILCFVWFSLSVYQMSVYEFGVNDCSNMVYRTELVLDYFGIDSSINERSNNDGTSHVWIVINFLGFQIPYEATNMMVILDHDVYTIDRTFDNTSEIVRLHPSLAVEYVK